LYFLIFWFLIISSAHNGGFFSNCFELKRTLVYIHLQYSIANQKSVRYSVSMSYFTNIAVGPKYKQRLCLHYEDLTWSLKVLYRRSRVL
jgi:hypothetical protein